MTEPQFSPPRLVAPETWLLGSHFPLPGLGILPVNAFVIRGAEPVLVDTGLAALREDFLAGLRSVIDPAEIRWIWLTHADADHTGNLAQVLALAPNARLVTTYLGAGKLGLVAIPTDRAYLLNPGQTLRLPDRELAALRPPTYDAPETTAFFDASTRVLFSADSFGALLEAPAETAEEVNRDRLREGLVTWATIDAPWLARTDRQAFRKVLAGVEGLGAETLLSSHLPPARGVGQGLLTILESAVEAKEFVGPDQAAIEAMMTAS